MFDVPAFLLASTIACAPMHVAAGECDKCTMVADKVELCRTHDKAEGPALLRAKKLARSKELAQHAEALKVLVGLSLEHGNAPSPEAARRIAEFLEHEQQTLRVEAVKALLSGQHPETVVATLCAEVTIVRRDQMAADPYLAAWAAGEDKGVRSEKEQAEFAAHLRVLHYGPVVLRALGKLPDDRSSAAVIEALGWPVESTPARFFHAAAESALELRTLACVEALVDLLARLDPWLAGDPPAEAYPWARNVQTLNDGLLRLISLRMQTVDCVALTERLRAVALELGLSNCPAEAQGAADAWKSWLAANTSAFRSELGTLETPVRASLESK